MYRLFLFCVMSAVVFGDNDEAKYIDLLPEAEKQEFLNRIARRIIEEIQAKDTPEKPQAEVSDDQLNVHHNFVQDILKEESESLRNERRNYDVKENKEIEPDNGNYETQKVADDNDPEVRENNQHIDLTLRNDRRGEENDGKSTEDSKFSVIPVKVIYEDNITGTQSPTYKTKLPNSDSEQNVQVNTDNSHFNISKTSKVLNESSIRIISEEKENINQFNEKHLQSSSLVSDDQSEIISKNDIKNSTNDEQNLRHSLEGNLTETQFSTDASFVSRSTKVNKNYDDSFENSESSTSNIYLLTSNKIITNVDSSPTENDNQLSKANTKPPLLTIGMTTSTQSNLNDSIHNASQYSRVYITTEKTAYENQNIKSNIENNIPSAQSAEKEVNNVKNSAGKEYLRTRLEIQLEENKFETEAHPERLNEPIQRKNNNIKQYYVYEVPEEKPIFFKAEEPKEKEQPYVVPVYNYEPRNAYYNAYNHFGINNDEEEKSIHDHENMLDEELNLRSGFNIDLNPKGNSYMKDKKGEYRYLKKHPRHSQLKYILNSRFEYNPNVIDYENNQKLKQIIKRDNNFKEMSWYNDNDRIGKWSQPPKIKYIPLRKELSRIPSKIKYINLRQRPPSIPSKIKYIPLRKRNEFQKGTSRRKYKRIYSRDKLQKPDTKDSSRAVKTFLYENKKFGHLRPTYKSKWSKPLRVYDGDYDLESNENNVESNNIDMDYYFGKYELDSKARGVHSDEEYSQVRPTSEQTLYDFTNKEHYRVEGYDCGHDCIEMGVKIPKENTDKYMETLIQVLKDMIYRDNTNLVKYNWLLSTVYLEGALKKIIDMVETLEEGNRLHPLDLELLNYIVELYNTSRIQLKNKIESNALQGINDIVNYFLKMIRRRIALPKNRNRRPGGLMNNAIQIWNRYYIRDGVNDHYKWINNAKALRRFKMFLNDLEDEMFDLHNALKHISLVTTYAKQNWYNDLKDIYLKHASKKQLLQVILHLAASRLFSSIENTAKNAEEDELYIKHNGNIVKTISKEFVFVLRVLEVIKKANQ